MNHFGSAATHFRYLVNAEETRNFYKTFKDYENMMVEDPEQAESNYHHATSYSVDAFKYEYAMIVIYPVACALPKLLLCVLYLQIFSPHPRARQITRGVIVLTLVNCIAWLVPAIVRCHPISNYWKAFSSFEDSQDTCIDDYVFKVWITMPNIASDIVLLILPMPILIKMHMGRAKRVGLITTFAAGCAGIVGACVR